MKIFRKPTLELIVEAVHMRFGCCSNMLSSGPGKTGAEIVEKLAMAGFEYIELSLVDCMALSLPDRKALAKRLENSGLRSEVVNSFFPRECKTTGPDADPEKIRAWYREALDLAKELGAETVVYGSPYSKSYPLGFSRETAMEQLIRLHQELDEYAQSVDLTILIEPCHRFECNLINTFAEGVELADAVGGKRTKVLFDYYHFFRNGETLDALRKYGAEYLDHIHFACPFHPGEPERTFPKDRNEWAYGPFLQTVKAIGYDGRVSIEAFCKDLDGQVQKSLILLKELF